MSVASLNRAGTTVITESVNEIAWRSVLPPICVDMGARWAKNSAREGTRSSIFQA